MVAASDPVPPPPNLQFDPSSAQQATLLTRWATADPLTRPRGPIRVRVNRSTNGRSVFSVDPDGTPVITLNQARPGDFYHEEGHAFDQTTLTPAERIRFRAIMHDPRAWGAVGASNTGGEPN